MGKEIKAKDILGLPVEDRLRLVEDIWDSLAADPSAVPAPDWHLSELDQRVANHKANPGQIEPWKEVRKTLAHAGSQTPQVVNIFLRPEVRALV